MTDIPTFPIRRPESAERLFQELERAIYSDVFLTTDLLKVNSHAQTHRYTSAYSHRSTIITSPSTNWRYSDPY